MQRVQRNQSGSCSPFRVHVVCLARDSKCRDFEFTIVGFDLQLSILVPHVTSDMSKRDHETMADTTPTEGTEGGLLREPQVSFLCQDRKLTLPRSASTASVRTRTSLSIMSSTSECRVSTQTVELCILARIRSAWMRRHLAGSYDRTCCNCFDQVLTTAPLPLTRWTGRSTTRSTFLPERRRSSGPTSVVASVDF